MRKRNIFLMILIFFLGFTVVLGCMPSGKNPLKMIKDAGKNFNPGEIGSDAKPKDVGMSIIYSALSKLSFISPLAVIAMILGGVAFAYGHTMGLKLLGGGFVALTIYLGVLRYLQWLLWLSFIGGACLVIYLVLIRMRSWKDTVKSIDTLLDGMGKKDRDKAVEVLKRNQSKFTRNKVDGIKIKLDKEKKKENRKADKLKTKLNKCLMNKLESK